MFELFCVNHLVPPRGVTVSPTVYKVSIKNKDLPWFLPHENFSLMHATAPPYSPLSFILVTSLSSQPTMTSHTRQTFRHSYYNHLWHLNGFFKHNNHQKFPIYILYILVISTHPLMVFPSVLGIKPGALHIPGRCPTTEQNPSPG